MGISVDEHFRLFRPAQMETLFQHFRNLHQPPPQDTITVVSEEGEYPNDEQDDQDEQVDDDDRLYFQSLDIKIGFWVIMVICILAILYCIYLLIYIFLNSN